MPSIPSRVPPVGLMGVRKSLLVGLAVTLLVVGLGAAWLVQRLVTARPKAAALPPVPVTASMVTSRKAILADEPRTYDAIPKPEPKPALPPQGVPVARVEAATVRPEPPRPEPRPVTVHPLPTPAGPSPAEIEARIRAGVAEAKAQMLEQQARMLEAQLAAERARQPVQGQPGAPGQAGDKKHPGRWFANLGDGKSLNITKPQTGDKKDADQGKGDERQEVIARATWAKPLRVDRVLYWDQPVPVVLATAINSDIPGDIRLKVTRDVLDRELRGIVLIPALTSIRGHQDGGAKFGQERIPVTLTDMIFPDGTVVQLPKSALSDASGATGMPAEVNNHYGKLLAALALNVGFNVGARYAAGQPRGEQYSIEQELVRESGQGVQREGQRIAEQFRVPPTLVAKPGDEGSVYVGQNLNFSQLPKTVR